MPDQKFIGNEYFITFYAVVLSRMAYLKENEFMGSYRRIFGPVIPNDLISVLNDSKKISDLLDSKRIQLAAKSLKDVTIYTPTGQVNIVDYAEVINAVIQNNVEPDLALEETKTQTGGMFSKKTPISPAIIDSSLPLENAKYIKPIDASVFKFISIADSNYGNIYVVADKRMNNFIWIVFRGTYSAKTAAAYSKFTSIFAQRVCEGENYLYGIFKITIEAMHSIVEATRYLAENFLHATSTNPVKVLTTGHSLGGAMATDFAYIWTTKIKKLDKYKNAPYNILSSNIGCFSIGSPRCMGKKLSVTFCNLINNDFKKEDDYEKKPIVYIRVVTTGDPVTGLPPNKIFDFQHPCSSDETMRKEVSEECTEVVSGMVPLSKVNYDKALKCTNERVHTLFTTDPLKHTSYLDINFGKGLDIIKFLKGSIAFSQEEIVRTTSGDTVCRIIISATVTPDAAAVTPDAAAVTPDAATATPNATATPDAAATAIVPPMSAGGEDIDTNYSLHANFFNLKIAQNASSAPSPPPQNTSLETTNALPSQIATPLPPVTETSPSQSTEPSLAAKAEMPQNVTTEHDENVPLQHGGNTFINWLLGKSGSAETSSSSSSSPSTSPSSTSSPSPSPSSTSSSTNEDSHSSVMVVPSKSNNNTLTTVGKVVEDYGIKDAPPPTPDEKAEMAKIEDNLNKIPAEDIYIVSSTFDEIIKSAKIVIDNKPIRTCPEEDLFKIDTNISPAPTFACLDKNFRVSAATTGGKKKRNSCKKRKNIHSKKGQLMKKRKINISKKKIRKRNIHQTNKNIKI